MEVKNILRNRRLELGLTMKEVADLVGVSEATISRWESGDIENMKRDKIASLAKALRIKPSVIMGWDDNVSAYGHSDGYYVYGESAKVAQAYFEDPMTRALFDARQDVRPEDVQIAIDLLKRLKRTNPDG